MNKLTVVFLLALGACGGSKSHEGGDLAMSNDDMAHAAPADLSSTDAAMPIVVPQPTGTKIASTGFLLYGVTATDGLLIGVDATSGAASAMDPTSGTLTAIATADAGLTVIGDVVFVGHDADANGNSGLGVWTKANGYHDLGVTGSQTYTAFTDGTLIGYFAGASQNSQTFIATADVYIDNLTHTAAHKVVSQLVVGYGFGTGAFVNSKAIVGHAPASSTDGVGTITAYDATGTGTDLLTNASVNFFFNSTSTLLAAFGGANMQIYDFTSGNTIALPVDVSNLTFGSDTSSAYAATSTGALVKVRWTGSVATEGNVLVTSGVYSPGEVSPDGTYLFYTAAPDQTTFTTDLSILPLAMPSATRSLASTGVNSEQFSSSGDYMLWVANQDANYIGDLFVASSASGAGTKLSATASGYVALGDTKILAADDVQMDSTSYYYSLDKFDLTMPTTAPTRLATNVSTYAVSHDNSTLYFSIAAGQYVGVYKTSL